MSSPLGSWSAEPSPPIFISYRRSDTLAYAWHLYSVLIGHFGSQVAFMDIPSLDPGTLWLSTIQTAARTCQVMLVVIGKQWLTITDSGTNRRRLDDPQDVLRAEVAQALERGIPVVPVLVEDAVLPRREDLPADLQPLVDRQARRISCDHLPRDIGDLAEALERDIGLRPLVAMETEAFQIPYAAPASGAATIMFAVNPELRDVLIVLAIVAAIVALAYIGYKSYECFKSGGWQCA